MKENLTEIVFILDRSGSMAGLEADTIGGYNSFIEKQKKTEGEALVSTVLFNTESKVVHDRVPIEKVEPMNDRQYQVGGCTALLDAVGYAVKHISNVHKYIRKEDVPAKTVFVITTDGEENSSRRYSLAAVKKMISEKQDEYGWEFLFLGANIDAVSEAGKLGIKADHAVRYVCDSFGTILNFQTLGNAICKIRNGCALDEDWAEEIADYQISSDAEKSRKRRSK